MTSYQTQAILKLAAEFPKAYISVEKAEKYEPPFLDQIGRFSVDFVVGIVWDGAERDTTLIRADTGLQLLLAVEKFIRQKRAAGVVSGAEKIARGEHHY